MAIKTYTITLGSVTNNGVTCPNPVITLVDTGCLSLTCIDEAKGVYKVEVDESCDDQCFDFHVICEECGDCPPVLVTKCICDSIDDCGACETCLNGICVDRCAEGQVCKDDTCVGCIDSEDCPGDQQCINGECACPPGTTPDGDRCLECVDGEEEGCLICIDGRWVEKDCGEGACDPETGNCEECINEDQCRPDQICVNNECECPPGFIEVGGECVEGPQCLTAEDCPPCHVCRNGQCVPQQCPEGQVCIGEEGCVPICDCDDLTGCEDVTRYCYQDPNSGLCGCVPCQGDCTQGCQDPCFCSDVTQTCVNNPCEGPCDNGLDCGEGCGCLDGQCVPCELISCLSSDCERALGCSCNGINCQDSDIPCNNVPCSTQADCGEGCTCVEGECVSCSNFSCANEDCSSQPGCECNGTQCEGGGEEPCSDNISVEKSDADCSITGTLETNSCCQCPQLTVDSLATGSLEGDVLNLSVSTELRKGVYSGGSPFGSPRVDDFSNENIAENEPPTSGSIRLTYTVVRDLYNSSGGYIGTENDTSVSSTRNYPAAGNTASVIHSGLTIPSIGSEVIEGNVTRRVASIEVQVSLTSNLVFPNGCTYSPTPLYSFTIENNSDYGAIPTLVGAEGLSTDTCRPPLFKWYKTNTGEFTSTPFRKLYVPEDSPGVYIDTLNTLEEGAESCFDYLLDTDCNCVGTDNEYVVFCNPEELDYTLSNCGRTITINTFSTCAANESKEFYVTAGTLNITFLGSNPPVGVSYTSSTQIETIEFGLSCDEPGVCTKTYTPDITTLEPVYTTTCNAGQIDVVFTLDSGVDGCFLDYVSVDGSTVAGGGSISLDPGSYEATAYWTCGCDPTNFTIEEYCCESGLGTIERDCTSITCITDPNTTYSVGGVVINDICGYIAGLGNGTATTVRGVKEGCPDVFFPIPNLTNTCCTDISASYVVNSPGDITITVVNYNLITGVTISPLVGTITNISPGVFRVTGLIEGDTYTVTLTDSICGAINVVYNYNACEEEVVLAQDPDTTDGCVLTADSDQDSCDCFEGTFTATVDSVNDTGTSYEVTVTTSISGFDNEPVSETLTANGTEVTPARGTNVVIVPKPIIVTEDCDSALASGKIISGDAGKFGLNITLFVGGDNIFTSPTWTGFTGTVNGDPMTVNASSISTEAIYTFGEPVLVEISAVNTTTGDIWSLSQTFSVQDGNVTVDWCKSEVDNAPQPLVIQYTQMELEDGCIYNTVSNTFLIKTGGTSNSPIANLTLTDSGIRDRKVKYVWTLDGVDIYTEFSYTDSTLPFGADQYDNGSDYTVTATCNCEVETEIELCCAPTITPTVVQEEVIAISLAQAGTLLTNSRRHNPIVRVQYQNISTSVNIEIIADDGQIETRTVPIGSGTLPDVVFIGVPWKEAPETHTSSLRVVGGPIISTSNYTIFTPWQADRALHAPATGFEVNSATACGAYSDDIIYYIYNQGAGFDQIGIGQVLFYDRAYTQPVNGGLGWTSVRRDGTGELTTIQVDTDGTILDIDQPC